ncbi:acyl-CoA carboxylase subunit epsilon [Streptomyces sp. WG-D5]
MSSPVRTDAVVRVERGNADDEELAAVVALLTLLARGEDGGDGAGDGRGSARAATRRWRPQEEGLYRAPHSWR